MSKNFFADKAIQHSRNSFLNSLLREWHGYSISETAALGQHVSIQIDEMCTVLIPLIKKSELGRHHYGEKTYLKQSGAAQAITFLQMTDLLSKRLAKDFDTQLSQVDVFTDRLNDSIKNIETSLQLRKEAIDQLQSGHINFLAAEQGLMVGHNFHPTPKSRDEFSEADLLKYAPEFGGEFSLDWFMASPEVLHQNSAAVFSGTKWTKQIAAQELGPQADDLLLAGFVPVPMHPWQCAVLRNNSRVKELLQQKKLFYLGQAKSVWHPTSSLRSIYREDAPYMLKFSISLRMTNSVRHLLPHEVERGLQLYDVLATAKGQQFVRQNPNFHVIGEPSYLALKNSDGSVMIESIVVCRENPFNKGVAENKIVLATLTQDAVLSEQSLIQNLIQNKTTDAELSLRQKSKKWFQKYLEVAVKPFVLAQANYGIVLGAHQQNLILGLTDGYPTEAFFRDCQGTGYTELGFTNFAKEVPLIDRQNGNVITDRMSNYLFAYYLILNSTFNVITAIAASGWVAEEELLQDLQLLLKSIYDSNVKDPACLEYMLFQSELMHKGNFICSFRNINENTTVDPLVIYTPVKNSVKSFSVEGVTRA